MPDAMSSKQRRHWCPETVREFNIALDGALRGRFKVGLKLWKIAKSIVDLGTLLLVGYAITEGAEPGYALLIAAAIISGPEAFEWVAVREDLAGGDESGNEDGSET